MALGGASLGSLSHRGSIETHDRICKKASLTVRSNPIRWTLKPAIKGSLKESLKGSIGFKVYGSMVLI